MTEDYKCWNRNPEIQSWQKANGLDDDGTYAYFVNGTAAVARANKRIPVQWVEVFETFGSALSKDTVVHVWKDKSTLNSVLLAGYKALISDQADWYLDHEEVSWEQMYKNEPTQGLDPSVNVASLLLGGEACLWAENVDSSVLLNTLWPRAAAVAERLWTALPAIDSSPDLSSATDRIETFRCLLESRGVGAAPATNRVARMAPRNPSSCYTQRGKVLE